MTLPNIHKRILSRLALVWLILSVLTGIIVYYAGQYRLEQYVVSLAELESRMYLDRYQSYHKDPSPERRSLLDAKVQELVLGSAFLTVEIYNRQGQKVTDAEKNQEAKLYEARIPKHTNDFAKDTKHHHFIHYLGKDLFLQVFVPIREPNGTIIGFFEGVYQVNPETLRRLQGAIVLSLVMVILAIFITSLTLYPVIISLNKGLLRYSLDLTRSNLGTLEALGSAIAKRDSDTNSHNYRVTLYALRLAELLNCSTADMQRLMKGAFLHDVGKIAISDTILLKRGKLTTEEFQVMKTHILHGTEIVQGYAWLQDAEDVVRYHHEKYDGTGYQEGLTGEAIPVNARIFAIVDVFDALTSRRPYKEPWPLDKALETILSDAGTHFDPQFALAFCHHAPQLYAEICNDKEIVLREKLAAYMNRLFPEPLSRFHRSERAF